MKTILQLTIIAGTFGILHAEEPTTVPEVTPKQEVSKDEAAKASKPRRRGVPKPPAAFEDLAGGAGYKPQKAVSKAAGKGAQVLAATRGTKSDLKLVALAPESNGVTLSAQPRIWWWQSTETDPGELEFTLSKVGKPTRTVFAVKIGARKKGYHAIDLSDVRINPKEVSLEPGATYLWSLGCDVPPTKAGEIPTKNSVKVFLVRKSNEELEEKLNESPVSGAVVSQLSDSGNWYELFDMVAFSSGLQPDHAGLAELRDRLLGQVDLKKEIKP
jgi:hypothetical protein